ncbi:response regulator [Arenibacter sp. 6A1]|nr:response regulator [Arenibacter sp. 6A1]
MDFKNIKILIVEDNPISSFISTNQLKKQGFENIDVVGNGLMALEYLEETTPDLIFLDLNMPVIDGFEFLKLQKRKRICLNTAIVILTSSIWLEDKKRVIKYSNVIDFLVKPLDGVMIKEVFQKLKIVSRPSTM